MTVRRFLLLLCLLSMYATFSTQPICLAADQFPYQAIVVGKDVEVRCGPGTRFYVTSHAKENDQVTVHRHDHGGWYMISPPPGSFSWIEAEFVKTTGSGRGVVSIDPSSGQPRRAVVRIGSQLSDDHSFYGRELSNGDEVTILGEKTLSGPTGKVRMYKIAPPPQEFRWIKGEFLVPLSRQIQQQIATDPYQVPAEFRKRYALVNVDPDPEPEPTAIAKTDDDARGPELSRAEPDAPLLPVPEAQTAMLPAPDATASDSTVAAFSEQQSSEPSATSSDFARLDEIDRRYQEMVKLDPAQWDLQPIADAYRKLQETAGPHVSYLAGKRLEVVRQRLEIARHYQKFIKVAAETSERDARLLAQQADFQVADSSSLDAPDAFQPPVEGNIQQLAASSELSDAPRARSPLPTPAGVSPQLNGAGILRRVYPTPGLPRYALVAPDGHLLAYLEPGQGVSLEPWVGRPAGVIGLRTHEPSLRADLIRAQRIIPVQLTK